MKYNLNGKPSRFAQRTLANFSQSLFDLLTEKAFESISVNELCQIVNYPRATFYNYFEDIFDLLDYCWYCMSKEMKLDEYLEIDTESRLYTLFNRFYDYMISYNTKLGKIMKNNALDGTLVFSFRKYLIKYVSTLMNKCDCENTYPIPYELMIEYYSNTVLLVIEWCFLKEKNVSKDDANHYLGYLLNNI